MALEAGSDSAAAHSADGRLLDATALGECLGHTSWGSVSVSQGGRLLMAQGPPLGQHCVECSGLLGSRRQLFDLPAVEDLQRVSGGLVELGVQGAAEVIDGDVWEGVKVDDDPVPWGRLTL